MLFKIEDVEFFRDEMIFTITGDTEPNHSSSVATGF